MGVPEDPGASFGSSFHPPLRVPSRGVRIAVQSALLFLVGLGLLVFHGLVFDLTPWSQVMINHIVERIYPDAGQQDTSVVLFREKNLRELNAGYPVAYELQADPPDAPKDRPPKGPAQTSFASRLRGTPTGIDARLVMQTGILPRSIPGSRIAIPGSARSAPVS
jgi:hypothetical protein